MTKTELDEGMDSYFNALYAYANGWIVKKKRSYSAGDILTELYIDLERKKAEIEVYGLYYYAKMWIRNNINWNNSAINKAHRENPSYYDIEPSITIDLEVKGSVIDNFKESLRLVKCSDRVNQIFLEEVAGDFDHTPKTLSKKYGISARGVSIMLEKLNKELNK